MKKISKTSRSFIATATTLAVAASVVTPVAAQGFKDVPQKQKAAVDFVISAGAKGVSNTLFGTFQQIKRVDAAILLANILELDTNNAPDSGFKDVPKRAQGAVNALKAADIISGKNTTSFGSSQPLTRGELAIWIQKGFGLKGKTELSFTDVNELYSEAVQALFTNGVTIGISKSQFGVAKPALRGDVAVLLHKAAMAKKNKDFDLSIMHTNDVHSHTEKAPKRVTAIKEVRSHKPNALLLDAGDVFSGTLYFNEFQGQSDLEFMNYLGYDAMVFGNHEFDLGASKEGHKALAEFVKKAKFPLISANTDFSKDVLFDGMVKGGTIASYPQDGNIYNGMVKIVEGEKIGIFGLTTEETREISSPGKVEFKNYLAEAEKAVEAFHKQGINKIIAITHLGYDDNVEFDNDLELAKKVEGIDVIIGGHSHTVLNAPVVVEEGEEPTVIVQAGEYSSYLGTLDVKFDKKGKVIGHAGALIDISKKQDDPEALAMLKPYSDKIAALQSQSINVEAVQKLEGTREIVRVQESNLGNLITDAMLQKAKTINPKAVIAVTNSGGIRASIDAGDITLGEILTVMPFGNSLAIMNLKGSEIKTALEHSVSQAPAASGGFLQVSGMTFKYDSSKPAGQRVVEVNVKNADGTLTPLADDSSYVVATNTFTAKGGDGYNVFKAAYADGRVSEPGFVDYEMFKAFLQTNSKVDAKVEGRIIDVAKTK
ncbi:5'-nucleotidase C-terminal domain-containing protein [Peribacillus acanthi]|uniref:5'-nucleotidase C-terminal domain-containing protein n=1 Tax=Peribacillus acanthi TaxID=2171554 RepID=UPI000D3E5089|nr:5'-nucleotidase C-terminal domain-containing protein [Peribacillus acanthi]